MAFRLPDPYREFLDWRQREIGDIAREQREEIGAGLERRGVTGDPFVSKVYEPFLEREAELKAGAAGEIGMRAFEREQDIGARREEREDIQAQQITMQALQDEDIMRRLTRQFAFQSEEAERAREASFAHDIEMFNIRAAHEKELARKARKAQKSGSIWGALASLGGFMLGAPVGGAIAGGIGRLFGARGDETGTDYESLYRDLVATTFAQSPAQTPIGTFGVDDTGLGI
jgi:hypothetical protein